MMKNFLKYAALVVLIALLLPAGPSMAQDQQSESSETRLSNGKELGTWWLMSPTKYKAMPNTLLYHFETTLSYSERDGNIKTENQSGKVSGILRKGNLTSSSNYNKTFNETTIGSSTTKVESDKFLQIFYLSFMDKIMPTAGFLWISNDSVKFIENRYIYYAGSDIKVIDFPKVTLQVGGYYAFLDTEYMSSGGSYDSDALYFSEKLRWNLTDTVDLTLNGDYLYYLKDSEYYFWNLTAAVNVKLTENISLSPSYAVNYDKNAFQQKFGKKAKDTTLSMGIKFSF